MTKKKTPAEKRTDTIRFQKEMMAMLYEFRRPKGKKQLLDEAQTLIYDAWESSPARALKLARKALDLSPDCADAYLLLAELEASTIRDQIALFKQAVEAGRRALGKKFFRENVGYFWGELDSRPFMRAMAALAAILWEIGQADEAIDIWNEMLRLNPNDNQGVRYPLLSCLLELKRHEEAKNLLKIYEEDGSAEWAYGEALLSFREEGDTAVSRRKLAEAFERNPHVPLFLLGVKKIPKRLPEYISIGDETEAASYAAANLPGWAKSEGALAWLAGRGRGLGDT
jgi:tetratricopeptide (TPR) repeat protein